MGEGEDPHYDSPEQAQFVADLLARHWKTIVTQLDALHPHRPIIFPLAPEDRGQPAPVQVRGSLYRIAAGLVVALVSVAIMYPRGSYISLGLAALWGVVFWLIVTNTIAVSIAIRGLARVWWGGALRGGVALTLATLICGIATFAAFGPLAVSGVAPPLLILPNTSAEP